MFETDAVFEALVLVSLIILAAVLAAIWTYFCPHRESQIGYISNPIEDEQTPFVT